MATTIYFSKKQLKMLDLLADRERRSRSKMLLILVEKETDRLKQEKK